MSVTSPSGPPYVRHQIAVAAQNRLRPALVRIQSTAAIASKTSTSVSPPVLWFGSCRFIPGSVANLLPSTLDAALPPRTNRDARPLLRAILTHSCGGLHAVRVSSALRVALRSPSFVFRTLRFTAPGVFEKWVERVTRRYLSSARSADFRPLQATSIRAEPKPSPPSFRRAWKRHKCRAPRWNAGFIPQEDGTERGVRTVVERSTVLRTQVRAPLNSTRRPE